MGYTNPRLSVPSSATISVPGNAKKGRSIMLKINKVITIMFVFLLVSGLSFAGGRNNKEVVSKEQTTIQEIDTTKLEKYEKKVIIKAKVGKGPGEIGVMGLGDLPEELIWEDSGDMEGPKGIAIDSAGYIYILDALNKRILRFSPDGRYIGAINLVGFHNRTVEGSLENHLFIDSEGNFFIRDYVIKLDERVKYVYRYDKNGKLLGQKGDMPKSVMGREGKVISSTIPKFTEIKAIKDTTVFYYISDSAKNMNCTLTVYLPKREGWEYIITPYSFLGFDKKGNSYIQIDAYEQTPDLPPKELSNFIRKEEQIVFKYNEQGKLAAVITEVCIDFIGYEIWALGDDGALYLMKYSFKTVVTDELPEWVKESDIPEEAKKAWRRSYTAPEGFVYVVKFTKVEEK